MENIENIESVEEGAYSIKQIIEFFNKEDISEMGNYMFKHHISANELLWEINQGYCLNTVELKNFLILSADVALGIAYEELNKQLKK